MSLPATCGECAHAAFARTPTGRIKRGQAGNCVKEKELLAMFTHTKAPPCVVLGNTSMTRIWPDYHANNCPMREAIKETP